MSYPGSGAGGDFDRRLPSQTILEQQSTAWVYNTKAQLAISRDTLEMNLTELSQHTTWKYDTNASKPSLPLFSHIRLGGPQTAPPDESWQAEKDKWLNFLPPDIHNRLLLELKKPIEMRSRNFMILDAVLNDLAKATAFLSKPTNETNETINARTLFNQQLPIWSSKEAFTMNGEAVVQILKTLENLGPNHPFFDFYHGFALEIQELLGELNEIMNAPDWVKQIKNNQGTFSQLIEKIKQILNHRANKLPTGQFHIFAANLQALEKALNALSLIPGSSSLFLGFETASIGMDDPNSEAYIIGPNLQKIFNTLNEFIDYFHENLNEAQKKFLNHLISFSTLGFLMLDQVIAKNGIASLPFEETSTHASELFGLELLLQLAFNTGAIHTYFETFTAASGLDKEKSDILYPVCIFLTLSLGFLGKANLYPVETKRIFEGILLFLKENSQKTLENLEPKSQNISSETFKKVLVFLQQAILSLNEENEDIFKNSCYEALSLIDGNSDELKNELLLIKSQGEKIANSFMEIPNMNTTIEMI